MNDKYEESDVQDPKGPLSDAVHVCRGASHGDVPEECRPAPRSKAAEETRDYIGLRLAFDSVDALPVESSSIQIGHGADDYVKKVLAFGDGLVEKYGRTSLVTYFCIAGAVAAVLTAGFCIRWWLATIVACIASLIVSKRFNEDLVCLMFIASSVLAIILFFCGV